MSTPTSTSTQLVQHGLTLRQVLDITAGALDVAVHHGITVNTATSEAVRLGHIILRTANNTGPALAAVLGLTLRSCEAHGAYQLLETFDGSWGGALITVEHVIDDEAPVGEIPPCTSRGHLPTPRRH